MADVVSAAPSYTRPALLDAVAGLAPRLRAASGEIEARRSLGEPIVQEMADAGLYRMLWPRSLGGGEVDPLTYFEVIEMAAHSAYGHTAGDRTSMPMLMPEM